MLSTRWAAPIKVSLGRAGDRDAVRLDITKVKRGDLVIRGVTVTASVSRYSSNRNKKNELKLKRYL